MSTPYQYPFLYHPCFSNTRDNLWARIHLPVAEKCNVKCIFCDHAAGSACHTSKPGYAKSPLQPQDAISRALVELDRNPQLKIVAISGPGEPLANAETFFTLEGIREKNESVHFCLSTNGILLEENALRLKELGVESISVSMSAIHPHISSKLYEWLRIGKKMIHGKEMGQTIITKQLSGIEKAITLGMIVKVNSILIPDINADEIEDLAKQIAELGVILQNIVPLVATTTTRCLRPPTKEELELARSRALRYIQQFSHCKQCRSDVVGIPGHDRIL